jgi:hypothetical protein
VALTPEEQANEAQMLLSLDQQFSMNPQDPSVGGLYGPQQRHALLSRAFDLLNIKDGASFLQDPNDPGFQQQQQQMQQQQQEMQARQEEIEKFNAGMTARQVSVLEGQLELDVVKEQNRMILELEKQEFTEEEKEARLMLDTEKHLHDIERDQAELEIEREQKRNVSIG